MTKEIRNFAIIAHIDHGKSTISDRIIELCNGVSQREMRSQLLDSMDLERERGITIKAQTINLTYSLDNVEYSLNLIDTPGHVDFSYEVSRCLSACDGAMLVVDASQGVEAQTLANAYKAINEDLEILPVLNKVDLQSADVEGVKKQIEEIIGIPTHNAVSVSGKTGFGIQNLLSEIIYSVPHPKGEQDKPTKVLLFDAQYDRYVGIVMLVCIIDGTLRKGDKIKMLSTQAMYEIEDIGLCQMKRVSTGVLSAGQIGFICANVKNINDCKIGDTIVLASDATVKQSKGFQEVKQSVFCSLYPLDGNDYEALKQSIGKLALNDSSITYEPETSGALGFGFRCGFLGMLHVEIFCERLDREFGVQIITSTPSVAFKITNQNGEEIEVQNPSSFPDPSLIKSISEPIATVSMVTPQEHIGALMSVCINKRGIQVDTATISSDRVMMVFKIPLIEIITDFHDKIKSCSRGYVSFEWEQSDYRESDIVKVSILVNGESVDALSLLAHRSNAERKGRAICAKLKELIPRQMFVIPIQAAIGGKIIARETISAYKKDVTAKCYGGDISRKRKLLDKQKKGKKKMRLVGSVEVPQSAFAAVLNVDSDN
ncbi:MAG: elongation factor 4 [Alphaproteobacteria bacterium]|nr:elongation factor 4 [Rickettsiales bacterium]